jgi:hypothetical protein
MPPWLTHVNCDAMMHVPFCRQHAPVTVWHVELVHVVPGPRKTPFAAEHCCWVITWQVTPPLPWMQHAPVPVFEQIPAVEQFVPMPRNTPPAAAHCAAVRFWQATPAGLFTQHAPVCMGCGQFADPQGTPAPRKIPPACVHCCCVVNAQCPSGKQHAPGLRGARRCCAHRARPAEHAVLRRRTGLPSAPGTRSRL